MNKDKIVLFDWGGVVESHEANFRELKEAKVRVIRHFTNALNADEILDRWVYRLADGRNIGSVNNLDDLKMWVKELGNKMDVEIPFEEFKKQYEIENDNITYYKAVVDFAHSLKNKCKIGILSNLVYFDRVRIDKHYDLSKFDKVYLSFEIGLRKPDEKIFEYVTNDLGIDPQNILFIDDEEYNILAAKKMGWQTCQASGYELDEMKKAVEEFLR